MILLAHPSLAVLDGLAATLHLRLGVDRTLRATTAARCLELADEVRLAAAVVDVALAGEETPALCAALRRRVPSLVLVTDERSLDQVALLTSASAISLAEEGLDSLLDTLVDVLAGRRPRLPAALVPPAPDAPHREDRDGPGDGPRDEPRDEPGDEGAR